ncbi:MAG: hypothetical protein ACRDSR_05675 [Pseudonocardiaceae bacterium]
MWAGIGVALVAVIGVIALGNNLDPNRRNRGSHRRRHHDRTRRGALNEPDY